MEVAKPLHLARQRRQRAAWVFDLRPEALVFATIVLIALTSLLYLTQASNVAATGYDITYAQDRRVRLERDLQRLTLRAAELQSHTRLEAEATNKLGMVPAPVPEYLTARKPPVDVEAAVARAEREAQHAPRGWREQLAALLRIGKLDADTGASAVGGASGATRATSPASTNGPASSTGSDGRPATPAQRG